MEAIGKLRNLVNWFNMQSEYFNQQFTTINQLEKVYDYAMKHNLEFMDNDYLLELNHEELDNAISFINNIKKSK